MMSTGYNLPDTLNVFARKYFSKRVASSVAEVTITLKSFLCFSTFAINPMMTSMLMVR